MNQENKKSEGFTMANIGGIISGDPEVLRGEIKRQRQIVKEYRDNFYQEFQRGYNKALDDLLNANLITKDQKDSFFKKNIRDEKSNANKIN